MRRRLKSGIAMIMAIFVMVMSVDISAFAGNGMKDGQGAFVLGNTVSENDADESASSQEDNSTEDESQNTITEDNTSEETLQEDTTEELTTQESDAQIKNVILAAEVGEVSRIQWLKELTGAFEMTVAKDNYPDNYYSDMNTSSSDYYTAMLATEFGLVDVEAGEPLCPDDPVTREFAVHTLNLCLLYTPQSTQYTFKESGSVAYPDDIQAAVELGWFTLDEEKRFLPDQFITESEKNSLILIAQNENASQKTNTNYDSKYQFKPGVIVLPKGADIELTDENEITLTNCETSIKTGDLFGFEAEGYPFVKKAESVEQTGNKQIIHVSGVADGDAYEYIDLQGNIDIALSEIQAADMEDVTISYIVGGTKEQKWEDGEKYSSSQGLAQKDISAVQIVKSYDVPRDDMEQFGILDDIKPELTCFITNVKADVSNTNEECRVSVEADVVFYFNVDVNVLGILGNSASLEVARIPILYFGYASLTMNAALNGSAILNVTEHVALGIKYDKTTEKFRFIKSFKKESFSIQTEVKITLSETFRFGFDVYILNGSLYAKWGANTVITSETFTDGSSPQKCTHVETWMSAETGGYVKAVLPLKDPKLWEHKNIIYNKNNSPVRVAFHYEDGKAVDRCTRDTLGIKYKYYTPANSRYGYNGASSGTGSDGKPYTIFNYSLNSDNQATITGYNGNVSALQIPSTLDGYPVVGIGNYAFQKNTLLRMVTIPDSVTEIGSWSFDGCKNISSLKLSKNLKKMSSGAFGNCVSLTSVQIPKSLTEGERAFSGCSKLEAVSFETGTTRIAYGLFWECTGIKEITIPDTVTYIANSAFYNATNLKTVKFGSSVTEIGDSAFNNCTSLTKIETPENTKRFGAYCFAGCSSMESAVIHATGTSMSTYMFDGCVSLKSVTLPVDKVNIQDYMFQNCSSLTDIVLPDTLKEIGAYSFYNCDSLTNLTIPSGVTAIGSYAFYDCDVLTGITIPGQVTSLGTYAFCNCEVLKDVSLGTGLTQIPNYAFYGCPSLKEIVIPYYVKQLGSYSFKNCTSLVSVTLPRGLTSIGTEVFSYPGKMTIYGIAGTYAETYAQDNGITFIAINVPATEAKFNTEQLTIVKGNTQNLALTVTPSNCTDIVNWKSSNTSVATVTDVGTVKGVAVGEAKIRAIFGDTGEVTAVCNVTVVQPVTSISMSRTSITLEGGNTYQLTAIAYPMDAYERGVTWTSFDESVATVSENGLVTALAKGSTKITATANDGSGKTGTCTVTVSSTAHIVTDWHELESKHNYDNNTNEKWYYTLPDAENLQITFSGSTLLEEDADYLYIYNCFGSLIGKYTGMQLAGNTVQVEGDSVCLHLVTDDIVNKYGFKVENVTSGQRIIELNRISLSKVALTLKEGEQSQQLTLTYDPENATVSKQIVWASDDESIATVSDGVVTGVGAGTAFVTATVSGKSAICRVAVTDKNEEGENDNPSGEMWVAPIENHVYNGKAIRPVVLVYDGEELLRAGTDYTLKYKNNVKAGEASVVITGKGNYKNSITKTFQILPKNLKEYEISADELASLYNGKVQQPIPTIMFGKTKLKAKTDFVVSYPNSSYGAYKNEGIFLIKVSGVGNYTGDISINFTISKGKLASKLSIVKIPNQEWTGKQIKPSITVKDGKNTLCEGIDYEVDYSDNVAVGTACVTIKGLGKYCGIKKSTFKITGKSLNKAIVTGIQTLTYTGESLAQDEKNVQLLIEDKILTQGKDYLISYSNNIKPGKRAMIVFTGINKYQGSVLKKTFTISSYDIGDNPQNKISIYVEKNVKYTKGTAMPEISVEFAGEKLEINKDYTVTCSNHNKAGVRTDGKVPTVTIKGKGGFCGTYATDFKIMQRNLSELTDRMTAEDKVYTGKANYIPTMVTIMDINDKKLAAGTDYTLSYTYAETTTLADGSVRIAGEEAKKTDKMPKNTTICVTAIAKENGNYCGSVTTQYCIVPKSVSNAKVTVKSQIYTGNPILLKKDDIIIMIDKIQIPSDEFEIVQSSYKNNIQKGTASVIIRGCSDTYGGTKKITFKIAQKDICN